MYKNSFLDQTLFYKSFLKGLYFDVSVLFRFFLFIVFVSIAMEIISYFSINSTSNYSFIINVVKSLIELPIIFMSFLFYKFYIFRKIKFKSFFNFKSIVGFYISSLIYCFILLFLMVVSFMFLNFTDLGLLKVSNDIVNDLEKLLISFSTFDYLMVFVISIISAYVILSFIFIFYCTTVNMKLSELSFFQSIWLSIKQVFKNTLFLLIPLVLFLFMVVTFSYFKNVNYIDINIKTYILTPLFTVVGSYYLFNLYLMVFKKNINVKYLK